MSREYTIEELAEATGLSERTLRLYRTRGLVDAPVVRGRVGYYDQRHMAQLRMVKALVDHGFPLAVIASLTSHDLVQVQLARLLRSMLTPTEGHLETKVTLDPRMVASMDRQRPGLTDELVRLGVLDQHGDGSVHGDPVLMAVVNALYTHQVSAARMGELGVHAGQLAEQYAAGLTNQPPADLENGEVRRLLVELATSAFREALSHELRR